MACGGAGGDGRCGCRRTPAAGGPGSEAFGFDPQGSKRLSMRGSRTVADVALVLLTVGLFVVFAAVLKGLERL
ncbi:hypothetical protein Abr02nite_39810 [Paractinoplanes brasiliensis]|nr:hypothetical protein Abr02nite_39810 [Actinoplanes brasiliensis]